MQYIFDRLKEASTWRGIILVIGSATGIAISPELTTAFVTIALAIMGSGVIGALFPDAK